MLGASIAFFIAAIGAAADTAEAQFLPAGFIAVALTYVSSSSRHPPPRAVGFPSS